MTAFLCLFAAAVEMISLFVLLDIIIHWAMAWLKTKPSSPAGSQLHHGAGREGENVEEGNFQEGGGRRSREHICMVGIFGSKPLAHLVSIK